MEKNWESEKQTACNGKKCLNWHESKKDKTVCAYIQQQDSNDKAKYEGNSLSKLQIQVAT
jgi:hypothetical protein